MANAFDEIPAPPPSPFVAHRERVWGYAGFWWRMLAWAIDAVILSVAGGIVRLLVGPAPVAMIEFNPTGGDPVAHISTIALVGRSAFSSTVLPGSLHLHGPGVATIISLLIQIAYFTFGESSRWQATLGKRACGLRVTGLDGGRISAPRAIGRYFGKYLSAMILGVGFLMIAWTRRKQGLHDLLAETLVVRQRPPSDLIRFVPPA